jgi:hypothetical protein
MKLPRRNFLHLAAGAAALPALPRIAKAQAYPSRPVRAVVAFAPGGVTDTFARLMAQKLTEQLGKQVYVENIAGASGNLGTGQVAKISSRPIPTNTATAQRGAGTQAHLAGEQFKSLAWPRSRPCSLWGWADPRSPQSSLVTRR